jgi:hypothetical protein
MWWNHRASTESSTAKAGVSLGSLSVDRHAAFEEYKSEIMRRVDQEEREFHELMARLRMV